MRLDQEYDAEYLQSGVLSLLIKNTIQDIDTIDEDST